jgi:hypothetical protein
MHGVVGTDPVKVKIFFFHAVAMLLFFIIQRIYFSFIFFKNFCCALLCGCVACGTAVDPNSQVCSSAILVLPMVENCLMQL